VIRYQADADLDQRILEAVRRSEPRIDFRSARDGGTIGKRDAEVLEIADLVGRMVSVGNGVAGNNARRPKCWNWGRRR
jgi:hypothetical protein